MTGMDESVRPPDRPETETIRFVGGNGAELVGILHRPAEPAKASVLMAHCFTCSKDIHTMTRLARALTDAGFAAFRFDFTGLGDSEGDFAEKTLSGNVSDVARAATTLVEMGFGPYGLLGHSLGGAAALLAADRLKTVRSVVTVASPADANHVKHLLDGTAEGFEEDGRADISIGGRTFELEVGFLHDLETHDVLDAVRDLDRPYMVVHADDDTVVPVTDGERLHDAAPQLSEFARYPTGGHLFANRQAADQLAHDVSAWFTKTF